VLVTGGAGAVGAYAVQFAKLGGARVLATVSSPEKAKIAADAGADYVFNYKTENVVERVTNLRDGGGVDRIVEVEFGGNLSASLRILKPNGVIAAYASDAVLEPTVPFYTLAYLNGTVRFVVVFAMPEHAKRQAITAITGWLEAGALRHYVAQRFPLEETAAAHELVERGSLGNVVVDIAPGA
jgi:NADPH2:quinone reductase